MTRAGRYNKSQKIFKAQTLSTEDGTSDFPVMLCQRQAGESCHKMNGASNGTSAPAWQGISRGV